MSIASPLPTRLFLVGLCVLATSCVSVRLQETLDDYRETISRLEDRLAANPEDVEALRALGVIYMRTNNPGRAHAYLSEAHARDAEDPEVLFYLGLASESIGEQQAALRLYERYPEVSRLSPYRRLLKARYRWVVRKVARAEMQENIRKTDDQLATAPDVIAVFPLTYQGSDSLYTLLGRGLAEILMLDLGSVRSLRVVERVRLQALRDELALAQSPYVDSTTAPRMGRWLGAGRMVGGAYNVLAGDRLLRLDAELVAVETGQVEAFEDRSGALERVFLLEKELVFNLIDEMGIELTPEERERIETIPTQNLQAFLAFSRGVRAEDAGSFEEALGHYRRAGELDPGFGAAGEYLEGVEGVGEAGSSTEEALDHAIEATTPTGTTIDLVGDRTQSLNEGIGSHFVPGQDAREPPVEPPPLIARPPPPPNRGGN